MTLAFKRPRLRRPTSGAPMVVVLVSLVELILATAPSLVSLHEAAL